MEAGVPVKIGIEFATRDGELGAIYLNVETSPYVVPALAEQTLPPAMVTSIDVLDRIACNVCNNGYYNVGGVCTRTSFF